MKAEEAQKASALLQRMTPNSAMAHGVMSHILPVHKQGGTGANSPVVAISHPATLRISRADHEDVHRNPSNQYSLPAGYTPFLESMDRDMKTNHLTPMRLPSTLTTEDFTRAVAVATVSALRHQGSIIGSHGGSGHKPRPVSGTEANHQGGHEQGNHEQGGQDEEQDGGGHEAPSWTRGFSACVLLGCTLLYAMIAGKRIFHLSSDYGSSSGPQRS